MKSIIDRRMNKLKKRISEGKKAIQSGLDDGTLRYIRINNLFSFTQRYIELRQLKKEILELKKETGGDEGLEGYNIAIEKIAGKEVQENE